MPDNAIPTEDKTLLSQIRYFDNLLAELSPLVKEINAAVCRIDNSQLGENPADNGHVIRKPTEL